MNYKLFFSDIDDTLVPMSGLYLSDYTLQVLKEAKNKSLNFIPCTGRAFSMLPHNLNELDLSYVVVANGGGIYDFKKQTYLYNSFIPLTTTIKLIEYLRKLPCFFCFYFNDQICADSPNYQTIINHPRYPGLKKCKEIKDFDEKLQNNEIQIQKFLIYVDPNAREQIKQQIAANNTGIYITSYSNDNIEVTNQGCTKGNALKYLCDLLGLKPGDCIYAGDNDNDVSALEIAGLAIVPSNATTSAKAVADIVAGSCKDEGVIKEIEKLI